MKLCIRVLEQPLGEVEPGLGDGGKLLLLPVVGRDAEFREPVKAVDEPLQVAAEMQ